MHDGMPYDPIQGQGQGHEACKVRNSSILKMYLFRHFLMWTGKWPSVLDTVGWVIWPVKIVPDMTYNVFGGTLNPTLLLLLCKFIML